MKEKEKTLFDEVQGALTKQSSTEDIKAYFLKVLELSNSSEQFPVDLDEVWPLVYSKKSDATEALRKEFIESVDYQVLRQNPQNPQGGRPVEIYKLTVSCLEYFIARKIRTVFEVYRAVFHKAVETLRIPQTYSEALRELADKAEENERLQTRNILIEAEKKQAEATIEEQKPAVLFKQCVEGSSTFASVEEMAKILCQNGIDIGQNRLFKWFVENKYLINNPRWSKKKQKYINNYSPMQRYHEMGLFHVIKTSINPSDREAFIKNTVKVTGKGQVYFVNKFLGGQS